ncbi:MAG: aminopeptidase P family protein [Marinilabiliaceae bacterium]|nr:aminopeptidase P family protein [Marinilabiliaceae bacterium]
MNDKTPSSELTNRILRFRQIMNSQNPNWQMAVIFSKINLFYFTGSMPEGMLLFERDGKETLYVRRSFERTIQESMLSCIEPMNSYRDVAEKIDKIPDTIYLETEIVPLAMYQRFIKHLPFSQFKPLDYQIATTRAIKSNYEIELIKQSGENHKRVLENLVPEILHEGMTEANFAAELYKVMVEEGHQGVARFSMFDTEIAVGQIGFGTNSLYPTNFNGPGGALGLCPAVPVLGSLNKKLTKGDLVFVDIAMGYFGYHTDKTMVYMFKGDIPDYAQKSHDNCVDIQNNIASMLKPGAIPSDIYEQIMAELDPDFLKNFMGFGNQTVKFLGHGIGLTVDEMPVIAKGFNEPLQENMVFALEPKKGIPDFGTVGIENTFIVTSNGGVCITGLNPGIIKIN